MPGVRCSQFQDSWGCDDYGTNFDDKKPLGLDCSGSHRRLGHQRRNPYSVYGGVQLPHQSGSGHDALSNTREVERTVFEYCRRDAVDVSHVSVDRQEVRGAIERHRCSTHLARVFPD